MPRRPALFFGAALWLAVMGGCGREQAGPDQAGKAAPGQTVVARVDGQDITLQDFQQRLAEQPAYVQARYASPDRRKELLENLVRFEVLAREAKKRGYDRDPDVVRHDKQRLIDRMIAEELDGKGGPPEPTDEELRRYYDQHPEKFSQPEAVRVSQILVADAELAARVAAAARVLGARDERGFRRLVTAHSQDEDSRERGGDLTFLERAGGSQPGPVIEAAFALTEPGQVSAPVKSNRGFHVLRLTERRAAQPRPFDRVLVQVRALVVQERRSRRIDEWVAEMRKRVNIQVFEDKLREVAATP